MTNGQNNPSALCHVLATASRGPKKGDWESIGAFLAQDLVLTTCHSVRHMNQITIRTADGQSSHIRFLNPVASDPSLDVAIIKLMRPVETDVLSIPRTPSSPARGLLRTIFRGAVTSHRINFSAAEPLAIIRAITKGKNGVGSSGADHQTFTAGIPVIPGYSGSPLLAEDGKTVLSVVTRHTPVDQIAAHRVIATLQEISGISLEEALPIIPFDGAALVPFYSFIRNAAQELKIPGI